MSRTLLALAGALEGLAAWERFDERKQMFAAAQSRATALGRPLAVVGSPVSGAHTSIFQAYGCGDICIDLHGCDGCRTSVNADITQRVSQVADNSVVVFCSCVLEYVSDPQAAWRELIRMAGTPDNVFLVTVQPLTFTAHLYPGARWTIVRRNGSLDTTPVTAVSKLLYGGALAALVYGAI